MERPFTNTAERPSHSALRRGDYAPIPSEPQEHYIRQADDDSPTGCCQSIAKLAIGRSSSSKHDNDEPLMGVVSGRLDRNGAKKADSRDEVREKLYADIERLQENISKRNERNAARRERLENLKAQDEAGKWEDELYLARTQELDEAHAKIQTASSVSTKDILDQVFKLNKKIAHIASEIAGAPLSGMKRPELNVVDTIQKHLGKVFVFLFQSDAYPAMEDRQLVQAVLQIFLARSCVDLIDCWAVGLGEINRGMSKLYDRILRKETQMVAGKWRQLAFSQLPPGGSLGKYAGIKARQALDILDCAGWGGGIPQVQPMIKELMEMADKLRKTVKADVISSDLQPWVAISGKEYHSPTMKDVTHLFGAEERSERLHVLGSTEIGLKACWKEEGSTGMSLVRTEFRTRVLCAEPLRRRLQGSQKRVPPSDSSPRPLTRGRSFSMS